MLRTRLTVHLYDCPLWQHAAAAQVLAHHSLHDGRVPLDTATPFVRDTAPAGSGAGYVASALLGAAPGASFVLWEDPTGSALGGLQAYAPRLGRFTAACDSNGEVVFTLDQVLAVIERTTLSHGTDIAASMQYAMGRPWMDDWGRCLEAMREAADGQWPPVAG